MPDQATLDFYQREAPSYTASGTRGQSRHLDRFLKRLEPAAHILELGCGGGRDAAYMLEHGFEVDATDGTEAMARKAHKRFDISTRVMRFDQLKSVCEYDAVWAHASLLHAPHNELPVILSSIHTALKPGGWHFANYKLGDGYGRDRLGRYYNFPTEHALIELYRSIPEWELVEAQRSKGSGYDRVTREWLAITIRKRNA